MKYLNVTLTSLSSFVSSFGAAPTPAVGVAPDGARRVVRRCDPGLTPGATFVSPCGLANPGIGHVGTKVDGVRSDFSMGSYLEV